MQQTKSPASLSELKHKIFETVGSNSIHTVGAFLKRNRNHQIKEKTIPLKSHYTENT